MRGFGNRTSNDITRNHSIKGAGLNFQGCFRSWRKAASLNSKINLAHAVSWGFKGGKLDIFKIGGLMQEQEVTELWETALTATHQPGLERIAWTESARHLPGSRGSKIFM